MLNFYFIPLSYWVKRTKQNLKTIYFTPLISFYSRIFDKNVSQKLFQHIDFFKNALGYLTILLFDKTVFLQLSD